MSNYKNHLRESLVNYAIRFLVQPSQKAAAKELFSNNLHPFKIQAIKLLTARIDVEEAFEKILEGKESEMDARIEEAIATLQEIQEIQTRRRSAIQ